ncbi:TetR/AcrR family transcriptional regulator [Pseudonocardia sp. Cha107L01]|uniref:TetR/AcrR family transcriptional regulator n=1 Tax=Pseudonocardia sp. Cha107L01 TaxID=3457576 RepID=UPI00403E469A
MLDNQASLGARGAQDTAPPIRQRRKRGDELRAAIHTAVLDELREHGFAALTMDAVAARAHTGKTTLYRYWPSKIDLVVDAAESSMSRIDPPDDDGDLRGQLLAVLRHVADDLGGPVGQAVRHLIAELVQSPELTRTIRPFMVDPVLPPILEVLRRAAVRGQIPVAALIPRVAGVGPDMLRAHVLINPTPIPDSVVVEIVDLVLLPLLRGYREAPTGQNT